MLILKDYYKGRDGLYVRELTPEIQKNARLTLSHVKALRGRFYAANPRAAIRTVNSGWRPPTVNRAVKKAAKKSQRLVALACDC